MSEYRSTKAVCTYLVCFGQGSASSLRAETGHFSSPRVQHVCNGRGGSCKDSCTMLVVNKDFANPNLSANIVNTCSLLERSVSHPRRAKRGATAACYGKHTSPRSCKTARVIIARDQGQRHLVPAVAMYPLEKVRNKSLGFPGITA